MAIPSDVRAVLEVVGEGARALFAITYVADELAAEHDRTCRGERIIVGELLCYSKNVFGLTRAWFDVHSFKRMIENGRSYDISAVLDAMDNLDVGVEACYAECEALEDEDSPFGAFTEWRQEAARMARHSVLVSQLLMVMRLKVFAIRFRKRVHEPGAALYTKTAKRFKTDISAVELQSL